MALCGICVRRFSVIPKPETYGHALRSHPAQLLLEAGSRYGDRVFAMGGFTGDVLERVCSGFLHALIIILERLVKGVQRPRVSELTERPSRNFAHIAVWIFQGPYERPYGLCVAELTERPSRNFAHVFISIRQHFDERLNGAGVAELAKGFGGGPSHVTVFGV